jgi:D-amino-acid dehydrogenase
LPWIRRFAIAAFRQESNTRHLAPLVLPAAANLERWLKEIGRPDLLRRHGYYEIGFGHKAQAAMLAQARTMARLGVNTTPMRQDQVEALRAAAGAQRAAGLWFDGAAHVLDPLEIVRAFAGAAVARGATVERMDVRAVLPRGDHIEIVGESDNLTVPAAVICAGVHSAPFLAPFGLRAPLQGARGYHIELPGHAPLLDAPILYTDESLVVTPMAGRLRASSYMEFRAVDAPPDPDKILRLWQKVRALGYRSQANGPGWMGARPVLPDYLPGIGRAPGAARLFYAVGHQHIGLTMATTTADLITDIVAERSPRVPIAAFDLRRFGTSR